MIFAKLIRRYFRQCLSISGLWTITELDMRSEEALQLEAERNIPELLRRFTMQKHVLHNIVPDCYLAALALAMVTAGGSVPAASELRGTYIALGTGSTAPAAGNTQLATEYFRSNIDAQSSSAGVAKNGMLLTTAEGNGSTIAELGLFAGNASASANSGLLASRLLVTPTIAKTVAKSVYFEVTHTFADA